MAAGDADRLSDLPDDLLLHVLRFAQAREGASTAVLSRRWRSPWRRSVAVYLDSRRHKAPSDFLAVAKAALAAAHVPVTKLTLDAGDYMLCDDLICDILASPAARLVEELRIGTGPAASRCGAIHDDALSDGLPTVSPFDWLSLDYVPTEALRVLHITDCPDLVMIPRPDTAFPHLEELQLRGCTVTLSTVQRVIDASPRLAALHLESTRVTARYDHPPSKGRHYHRFRGPTVAALVLTSCDWTPAARDCVVQLDMPALRYFKYHGSAHRLSFTTSSQPSNVDRVVLQLTRHHRIHHTDYYFWRLVQNFSSVRVMKLKLDYSSIDGSITDPT